MRSVVTSIFSVETPQQQAPCTEQARTNCPDWHVKHLGRFLIEKALDPA
jgi:hypothetical protein